MVHHDSYNHQILEKLNVGKSYLSPRVVRSLDKEKGTLKPHVEDRCWDQKFHILVPLDLPTPLEENQEYILISPRHHITCLILLISDKSELQYHHDTLTLSTCLIPTICTYKVEMTLS